MSDDGAPTPPASGGTSGLVRGLVVVAGLAALVVGLGAAAMKLRSRPTAPTGEGSPVQAASADQRPNVLIVLWDTTRADRMSLYGNSLATTPRMAKWAQDNGVVFEHAVSPDMWTVPSHASLFTGLPSTTHGASNEHRWLDSDKVTLAEVLKDAGYETYAFSANPNLSPDRINLVQGFDQIDCSWHQGFRKGSLLNMRRKLIPEDASTEISPKNPAAVKTSFYNAAPVTQRAFLRWLDRGHDPNKPFVAYLSYMEAHKPRIPSMASRRRVADQAEIDLGLKTDLTYESQAIYSKGKKSYTADELRAIQRVYDASLVDLDDATADLLDELRGRGVLDNTIVVFTSDHGEMLGEHQLFGHRDGLWEQLLHVPLVISYPKEVTPRRVTDPVTNTQVFSTLLGLIGIDGPDTGYVPGSLLDLTDDDKAVFSESLGFDKIGFKKIAEMFPDLREEDWSRIYRSVRVGPYKLLEIQDFDTKDVRQRLLFDLDADPGEEHDLSTEQPGKASELARVLSDWQDEIPRWTPENGETPIEPELNDAQRKQLEMLGYIEEEPGAGDE
ncbi:MAG: sulfatase [Alphaproteobacteria bacterium]|nr:sulfatase [Alphaproteobacteria bacterium]MCB9698844.1 sulfatase [Alphaproteobacteria bacterium]